MRNNRRSCLLTSIGVAACLTVVFVTTAYVFQGRTTYQCISTGPREVSFGPRSEGCSEIAELRENLTAVHSKADSFEEEIAQLSHQNSQLENKLSELQTLYNLEHQKLMQMKNGDSGAVASSTDIPTIFMITPTYYRWTQKADLTRLCQTLIHVRNLHWIVVEDADQKSQLVTKLLNKCTVTSTHLNFKTSERFLGKVNRKRQRRRKQVRMSRGVEQRNLALQWLRYSYKPGDIRGVVYFGDDDNTYDLQVFEEMRYIQRVGVWPVGIAGGLRFEGPVCKRGKVVKWHAAWGSERKFQIDFAGFAVALDVILSNESIAVSMNSASGYLENDFLAQVASSKSDLEPRANDCMKVNVWHTQTQTPLMSWEQRLIRRGKPSNPKVE